MFFGELFYMKYQTYENACSYAALANLLDSFGCDVQDRDIILGAQLAYMLRYDAQNRSFLGGTALEGREWFDLFLRPNGFRFVEQVLPRDKMLDCLWNTNRRTMLALNAANGERHALVFDGVRGESFRFLNIKWHKSPAPETYLFTAQQLLDCLDKENTIGFIDRCEKSKPDFSPLLDDTLYCLELYRECIDKLFGELRQPYELKDARISFFSALFDQLYPLFKLCGEARLVLMVKKLKESYDELLSKGEELVPCENFPMELLSDTFDRYREVVETRAIVLARDGV